MIGVSGPFPSLDLVDIELEGAARNAKPPRITSVSRALVCALSLSPNRSMIPPAGRKALRTWRRVMRSTTPGLVEDVEDDRDERPL